MVNERMDNQKYQVWAVLGVLALLIRMAQAASIAWVGGGEVRVDIYKNNRYEGQLHLLPGDRETVVLPSEAEREWMIVNAYTRYPICRFILDHDKNQEITVALQGCTVRG